MSNLVGLIRGLGCHYILTILIIEYFCCVRLKNIEIKGFKSFANQTILNFNEQVIGVVGPNGSGKSNIVDAFRWVLGEQKGRELRLDKMGDVIFNGTKSRKPSGVAQVSLTFENSEGVLASQYNQVTISRLLYRNGDSEYRLNNVVCRLKDIKSLFIDTGIGSNSYAIIALGMVDDILEDRENSRRRMFEQAAGISKYKQRKRETENKLKHTSADLDRVEDLLFEIEGNLKSLEKQARRAQKYLDIKADHKNLSVASALANQSELKVKQVALKKQIETEQDTYRSLDVLINQLEAKLAKEKRNQLEKERELSSFQKQQTSILEKISQAENDKNLNQQQAQFCQQTLENLKVSISNEEIAFADLDKVLFSLEEEKTGLTKEKNEQTTEFKKSHEFYEKAKGEYDELKKQASTINDQKQQIEFKIVDAEKAIAITENEIRNSNNQIETVKSRTEEIQKRLDGQAASKLDIERKLKEKLEEKQRIEKGIAAKERKSVDLQKEKEGFKKNLDKILRRKDACKNEFTLLKSMIDSLEGFPESIKYLEKSWNKTSRLLTDIISVDDDYKLAVEQYLEPYLNHYVVDTKEQAIEAIGLLRNAQKGKAKFFVLDMIKSKDKAASGMMLPSNFIPCTSIVETDKKYNKLVELLFTNVYIFDGEIDADVPESDTLTVLSKHGLFTRAQHTWSGGSVGLFEGKKIGRKQSLKKLERTLVKLEEEESDLLARIKQVEKGLEDIDVKAEKQRLERATRDLNTTEGELTRLETQRGEILRAVKENQERYQNYIGRLKEKEEALASQKMDRDKLIQTKEGIENKGMGDMFLQSKSEELTKLYESSNRLQMKTMELNNRIDRLQRESDFQKNRKVESSQRLKEAKNKKQLQEQMMQKALEGIKQAESKLIKLYEDKSNFASSFTQVEEAFYQLRGDITKAEEEIRDNTRKQNQSQVLINTLKEKYNEKKSKLAGIRDRLHIEFNVELEKVNKEDFDQWMTADLDIKLERIRTRIHNYGEVNPLAVEAYKEMDERYQLIKKQRDDINEAKEALTETIKQIESSATEQYVQSFEQVRANFREVFRSLFTEDDDCDLVMLDPENPLETKIEIVAKPKGKKPKSLNQLSGGEKTLTAIALLFSLYLLKPAPFCIFDEVDAPLDDANIQKFNKIIKKFSKDSQFIIVTHNKSTMADVDVLYGVYMQEQGVSGVSAVDFRSYEHQAILEDVA